jgi:hypothetical protein
MEVVGLIASAAQISVYACSIVSLISEIRSAARNGPLILQERSQQLVLLGSAVEKIRLDTALHTDVLSGYLLTIQHKIRTLHDVVRLRSQRPTNSSAQRLRTALAFVTRDKEVESSFASLQAHCQTLYFYMSSTGSYPYDGSRTASTCTARDSRDDVRSNRRPLVSPCMSQKWISRTKTPTHRPSTRRAKNSHPHGLIKKHHKPMRHQHQSHPSVLHKRGSPREDRRARGSQATLPTIIPASRSATTLPGRPISKVKSSIITMRQRTASRNSGTLSFQKDGSQSVQAVRRMMGSKLVNDSDAWSIKP